MRTFLGITGASGHAYAGRLIRALHELGHEVDLAVSGAGAKVLAHEEGVRLGAEAQGLAGWVGEASGSVRVFGNDRVEAPPASGTSLTGGVIVCPCSMGTLARIAAGFSSNLIERAADVALKEGRTLILVPRETPLSEIHLENMLRLARMGAVLLPAAPGFYHRPHSIEDLLDHVVGKILDRLGLEHSVGARWSGTSSDAGKTPEPPPEPGIEPPDVLDAAGTQRGVT